MEFKAKVTAVNLERTRQLRHTQTDLWHICSESGRYKIQELWLKWKLNNDATRAGERCVCVCVRTRVCKRIVK